LTDEQLLKIFVALNSALEDAETVSFIESNVENVQNNAQKAETSQKTAKRPRSPLPISEDSACASPPTSGGFNGAGKPNLVVMCYFSE